MKPHSFELTETDRDSICMALNEVSLAKCIKKEYYETYYKEIYNRCTDNDCRTYPNMTLGVKRNIKPQL